MYCRSDETIAGALLSTSQAALLSRCRFQALKGIKTAALQSKFPIKYNTNSISSVSETLSVSLERGRLIDI